MRTKEINQQNTVNAEKPVNRAIADGDKTKELKMETCIDQNGVIVCNECSAKYYITGQVVSDTDGFYCEVCGDSIN